MVMRDILLLIQILLSVKVVFVDHDQDSSLCALKDRAAEAIEEVTEQGYAAKIEVGIGHTTFDFVLSLKSPCSV